MGVSPTDRLNPVPYLQFLRHTNRHSVTPQPTCRTCIRFVSLTLLCAVLLASCTNRTELDNSIENLSFKTLSGAQIELKDTLGPTLINFWATSCAICLHEMPDMAKLYTEYADRGFELIAVAMPYDPPNKVLEYAESHNLPFPVALDIKGEAVAAFDSVKGTPTSYLLDKRGKFVKRYVGAIDLDNLREQLDQLLGVS